jgi:hypothetical protein
MYSNLCGHLKFVKYPRLTTHVVMVALMYASFVTQDSIQQPFKSAKSTAIILTYDVVVMRHTVTGTTSTDISSTNDEPK